MSLNNELQIIQGFAVLGDFDKGIDKVVVHGKDKDYFFVEDNNTWLDNKNSTLLDFIVISNKNETKIVTLLPKFFFASLKSRT